MESRHIYRWNVEKDGHYLLICEGEHDKGEKCQYRRYSPDQLAARFTEKEVDYLLNRVS